MRNLVAVGIVCGLSFLAVPEVAAQTTQTMNVTAQAGTTATVASLPSWNAQCRFDGYPEVTVDQQPRNGRIAVQRSSRLRVPDNAGRCAGSTVGGIVLRYTPNRGFRGSDGGRFSVREASTNRSGSQGCRYNQLPNGVILADCDRIAFRVNVVISVR